MENSEPFPGFRRGEPEEEYLRQRSLYEALFEEEHLEPHVIEALFRSARDKLLPMIEEESRLLRTALKAIRIGLEPVDRDESALEAPIAGLDGSINGDRLFGIYYALLSAAVVSYRRYEDPSPEVTSEALTLGFPPQEGLALRKAGLRRAMLEAEVGLRFLREMRSPPEFLFVDGPLVPSSRLIPLDHWLSYGRVVTVGDDAEYKRLFEEYAGRRDENKVGLLLRFYNEARRRGVTLVGVVKAPYTRYYLREHEDELRKLGLTARELVRHGVYDRLLVEFYGYDFLERNPDKLFYTEPRPLTPRPILSFAYGLEDAGGYRALEREDVHTLYLKTHLNGAPIRVEVFRDVAEDRGRLATIANLLHYTGTPYPRGAWPAIYVPSPILAAHEKCTVRNPTLGLIGEDIRNRSVKAMGDLGDMITRPTWVSWLLFRRWLRR